MPLDSDQLEVDDDNSAAALPNRAFKLLLLTLWLLLTMNAL